MQTLDWWTFLLVALAAYRLYRLIGVDSLTEGLRRRLLRLGDNWEKEGDPYPEGYRFELGLFITCPWCLGFWLVGVMLGLYCAIFGWLGFWSFGVSWLAMSAVVGLIAHNLDE